MLLYVNGFDGQKGDAYLESRYEVGDFLRQLAEVRSGNIVLDVGCGMGELTVKLAYLAYPGRVLGIDTTPGMLETAVRRAEADGLANIAFRLWDMQDFGFNDEFDLIFSSSRLHWVHNQKALLEGLYRALRRGGKIAAQFMAKDFSPPFLLALNKVVAEMLPGCPYGGGRYPWYMGEEDTYARMVADAGFVEADVFRREWPLHCASASEAVELFRTNDLLPYLVLLPETEHAAFCTRLVEEMEVQYGEGEFDLPYDRLFVLARKSGFGS